MRCPTCDGTGRVKRQGGLPGECPDCDGFGDMTRDQQSRYFWESGYSDAEAEQDFLDRAAEEQARLDEEQYGEAQAELEAELRQRGEM